MDRAKNRHSRLSRTQEARSADDESLDLPIFPKHECIYTWPAAFTQVFRRRSESTVSGSGASRWFIALLVLAAQLYLTGIGIAKADSSHNHITALSAVSCSQPVVTSSGTDACTVTLSAPAPKGGLNVAMSSSNAAVALPATVTVPFNSSSVGFNATISSVNSTSSATILAAQGGVSKTFTLQLTAGTANLSPSVQAISFGDVVVNTAARYSVTLTSTGTAPVSINSLTLAGTGFTMSGPALPITLIPSQSITLTVQFDPAVTGPALGQLTVGSNSSTNPTMVIGLSGTGDPVPGVLSSLFCSSSTLTGAGTDACTVLLSAPASNNGVTVNLSSSNAAVSVPASVIVPANSTNAGFTATVSKVTSPQNVTVSASSNGVVTGFVLQLDVASQTLSASASSVLFGNVGLGTMATQYLTLTSTGNAPVTVSSATVTGSGFTLAGALPITLNPNQAITLTLQFDPAVTGSVSGQLTVTSNSVANPTLLVGLGGTGVAHEVDLSWVAPSSSDDPVVGYNVYRAPSGTSNYQRVNASAVAQTTFTDMSIQSGVSYDYAVTSVDAAGIESAPSNTIIATVP